MFIVTEKEAQTGMDPEDHRLALDWLTVFSSFFCAFVF